MSIEENKHDNPVYTDLYLHTKYIQTNTCTMYNNKFNVLRLL